MNVIEFQDTTFYYYKNNQSEKQEKTQDEKDIILQDINLQVKKGEFIAIIGHNGSGKSTLAKHINALLLPSEGDVYVFETNTKDEQKTFFVRQKAGMVFQNPDNQMVTSIVEEDVAFAPENLGVPSDEIRKRVDEALKQVNMSEFALHAPDQLSGGQKQRVAIAGVLAMQSDIIVFDEPTAMLDPAGRKEVLNTILKLNKEKNITIILITHLMEEAAMADKIAIMDKGKIAICSTPQQVFFEQENNPNSVEKQIEGFGLELPFIIKLANALKQKNIKIKNTLDENEMVKQICQLILKT